MASHYLDFPSTTRMKHVSKGIIYRRNEYLLQLRDNCPGIMYPDQWSFFGGEIEPGETSWQALQRELLEELEWHPHEGHFLYEWINPEHPCCIYFFGIPFTGNMDQLILHEGQDLGWFELDEILEKNKIAPHVSLHLHRSKSEMSRRSLDQSLGVDHTFEAGR